MSQKDVEIAQRGWEHFLATGEPAWDTLHAEVEARDHDIFDGREYRGHAGIQQWLFEDAGDQVIAVFQVKARGRGSGVELERQDAMVFKMRDGMTVRIDYYNSKQQALKAVGLEE